MTGCMLTERLAGSHRRRSRNIFTAPTMIKIMPAGTPKRTRVVLRPAGGSVCEIIDHPMKVRDSKAKPIPK